MFFVQEFAEIYGDHNLVYVVHSLIHLAADCLKHGPLDSFSAFPYESYLGRLKRLIRSKKLPLAQLVNRCFYERPYSSYLITHIKWYAIFYIRISEIENARSNGLQVARGSKKNRSVLESIKPNSKCDSVCLFQDGTIVKVTELTKTEISGRRLLSPKDLYDIPLQSGRFEMYQSTQGFEKEIRTWQRNSFTIKSKCMHLYHGLEHCVMPLVHH